MAVARYAVKNVSLEPFDSSSDAVIISGGRFEAVGRWQDLSNAVGPETSVFDGEGASLIPGIDDSHLHGYMFGRQLTGANVSPSECPTMDAIRRRLKSFSENSSGWIRGFGWVSGVVRGSGPEGTPSHKDLAEEGLDRPIMLTDFSGHQAWCNLAALQAAGITRNTADPVGGVIVRDAAGEPTGLLLESAVKLVTEVIPKPSRTELKHALTIAGDLLIANGITSYTEPGLGPGAASLDDGTGSLDVIDAYRELGAAEDFHQRVDIMLLFGGLGGTTLENVASGLAEFGAPEKRDPKRQISVAQLKVFADGIPRSRTAWMSEPYDNHSHGSLTVAGETDSERIETLASIFRHATQLGWQLGIHATGDQSVSSITDIAEQNPAAKNLRNYIIHADLVKFQDFSRIAQVGLGLNMQPPIRWGVGRNVELILGNPRFENRLQLRTVAEKGINFALSSDAPVSSPDWRQIVSTAVNRSFKTETTYTDDQGLTPAEAFAAMTQGAAYQSHADQWRGKIATGYLADFVLLDGKIDFAQDIWAIASRKPRAVGIDGQIRYGQL
jgi:predicted amidohydrolase YtcJ